MYAMKIVYMPTVASMSLEVAPLVAAIGSGAALNQPRRFHAENGRPLHCGLCAA